jgi:1-deoxy-D-xylulose-5-phosphate synthase
VLMSPRDGTELQRMLDFALTLPGPSAIRYPRGGSSEESTSARTPIELGKAEVLAPGRDATILAFGPLVEQALDARRLLKAKGFEVEVVNARFAKPLDRACLRDRLRSREAIVTVEEHAAGGFGAAVLEAAAELAAEGEEVGARVVPITVPDRWIEHATTREEQLRHCGLDGESIAAKVEAVLRRGTRETAAV